MHSTDRVVAEGGTCEVLATQGTCQLWVRHCVAFAVYACDGHMSTCQSMSLPTLPDLELHLMMPLHAIDDANPL